MHPNHQQLTEFLLGKLDEEVSSKIEQHIQDCETCWNVLGTVADDGLVALAKQSELVPDHEVEDLPAIDGSEFDRIAREIGDNFQYQLIEKIGSGGMGDVYRAEHRIMGRTVAIKLLRKPLIGNRLAVQRFRNEVKSAARLFHPNIVAAFDAESVDDTHFLVTEFVDGENLAEKVRRGGPLPLGMAYDAIRQAAVGLQHAAAQSMMHRDIKPQNLILDREGQVKVLDFGLAKFVHESTLENPELTGGLTAAHTTLGTPDFVAPEQANDSRGADFRSDIYSLGCTFYFLVTGKVPFPNCSPLEKISSHLLKEVPDLPSRFPAAANALLRKMVAKDPNERFQTYSELIGAIDPMVSDRAITKKNLAQLRKAPVTRRQSLLVGVATIALLFSAWTIWSNWDSSNSFMAIFSRTLPKKVLYVIPSIAYLPDYSESYPEFEQLGASVVTAADEKWVELNDDENDSGSFEVDMTFAEVDPHEFGAVIFIGGDTLPLILEDRSGQEVLRMIRVIRKNGGVVGGICGGNNVLAGHGLLDGRRYANFPLENEPANATVVDKGVVADQNIVTTPSADHAKSFAESVMTLLKDSG